MAQDANTTTGYLGTIAPGTDGSLMNAITALVENLLARKAHTAIVKVIAVNSAGELAPVGLLDVQPLVGQIDGYGQTQDHAACYNLPYFRLQGGEDAIILDPKVNDIGLALFCDRDISTVKTTKAAGPPGSRRRNDWADGLYIGGFLNGTPTQYIRFSATGIQVVSPTKIEFISPEIVMTATTSIAMTAPVITEN